MSEDKINKEQHAATQTVAKALDDAIGDDDPVEHETAILARDQDGGHLGRPLTPTSSKTGKHATKSPFGPHHVRSYWTPERKREAAGDEDPTREHVNARKKGKSALDASPGVETPRKHDTTSKQSDRDGSPPPTPAEAEVEVDGRASSDDEEPRKDDAIDPIVDPAGEDTDVEDSREVDHSTDDPFLRDHMVFAKVGRTWYAGSISAVHPSGGDDGRFKYYVHTYADSKIEKVHVSRLKHFMHEGFEDMVARVKNSNCVTNACSPPTQEETERLDSVRTRTTEASITDVEPDSVRDLGPLAPRGCVCFRGRSDNEPSDEYDVVCTYITVINRMNVWPAGQDPTPPARGQQQQLSLHLEHEFLHSHDGHAQEVHPHDLHVVASGHAQLSGPQASQSFGQHAIVAGRSEVRRGMAKRRVPSVGRTSAVGRTRGSLAPRGCVCVFSRSVGRGARWRPARVCVCQFLGFRIRPGGLTIWPYGHIH